jgi:hypothetical protein
MYSMYGEGVVQKASALTRLSTSLSLKINSVNMCERVEELIHVHLPSPHVLGPSWNLTLVHSRVTLLNT